MTGFRFHFPREKSHNSLKTKILLLQPFHQTTTQPLIIMQITILSNSSALSDSDLLDALTDLIVETCVPSGTWHARFDENGCSVPKGITRHSHGANVTFVLKNKASHAVPTLEQVFEAAFNAGAIFASGHHRLPTVEEVVLRRDEMLNDPDRWVLTDENGDDQPTSEPAPPEG